MNNFFLMFPVSSLYGDWGLLLLRVVFGAIVIAHGFPKLKNLKETGSNFTNMGFRPGAFWGTLAALLESFGGIALILGIVTTPVAALFVMEFLVIVIWKLAKHMPFVSGWEFDLLILSAAAVLLFFGAGAMSLDHFWLLGF
jgi:putative oxidoreductase